MSGNELYFLESRCSSSYLVVEPITLLNTKLLSFHIAQGQQKVKSSLTHTFSQPHSTAIL